MCASSSSMFFTCGRGLEKFVGEELCQKYHVNLENSVNIMDGKVFIKMKDEFPSSEDGQILLDLKSPERAFVNVYNGSPLKIKHRKEFWKMKDMLHMTTVKRWQLSYSVWETLTSPVITEASSSLQKRPRLEVADEQVTFRVSCKYSGAVAKYFKHRDVSRCVCSWVRTNLSWQSDLKNPKVEVFVHFNNDYSIIGLAVTREPLSKRSYLECIALRPTICWAMASWADVKPSDVVLDPMCGAATLLTETVVSFKVEIAIGFDISGEMMSSAVANAVRSNAGSKLHFAIGDARMLPILSETVDTVLCDLPFGLKYGTVEDTKQLIPRVLREMDRVLKRGGRVVLLISEELVTFLLNSASDLEDHLATGGNEDVTDGGKLRRKSWDSVGKRYVKLGELSAFICKFIKPP